MHIAFCIVEVCVLVLVGIKLVFFKEAHIMLSFGFVMTIMVMAHWYFSC